MSAPVDEIDVGRDPRRRMPWHDWTPGRRRLAAIVLVVLLAVVAGVWIVLRGREEPAAAPAPIAVTAPGADVVVDIDPDTSKCPSGAQCRYTAEVTSEVEQAFRAAFPSAGFIGRSCIVDAATGEIYWQLIRFTTGALVTVTLTQQPTDQVPNLPQVAAVPSYVDLGESALTANAVRSGYLMIASAATLPGQPLPVREVQQWVRSVPAPRT